MWGFFFFSSHWDVPASVYLSYLSWSCLSDKYRMGMMLSIAPIFGLMLVLPPGHPCQQGEYFAPEQFHTGPEMSCIPGTWNCVLQSSSCCSGMQFQSQFPRPQRLGFVLHSNAQTWGHQVQKLPPPNPKLQPCRKEFQRFIYIYIYIYRGLYGTLTATSTHSFLPSIEDPGCTITFLLMNISLCFSSFQSKHLVELPAVSMAIMHLTNPRSLLPPEV